MTHSANVLVISLVGLLAACNGDEPAPKDIVSPQLPAQTNDIGYLVGSPIHLRNSALLAVEHINQAGGVLGKDFNVVVLQAENPTTAATKAITLMDDFAMPLLMVSASTRALAVAEQAVPRKVVVLSDTATSPVLTTLPDNDYVFRTAPSDVYQGRILADLAIAQGAKTASMVILADDVYGSSLAAEFKSRFEALGGTLLQQVEMPDNGNNFGERVDQVYQNQPDVVVLALLFGIANAQFINESVDQGFNGLYLMSDAAIGVDFTNNLASTGGINRAMGVSPSFGIAANPEFVYFRDQYLAHFGIDHQQFDPNVYDATMVAALAMAHAGFANNTDRPTGQMIQQSMRAVMNPPGIKIGPSEVQEALSLIQAGQAVDYSGSYSDTNFDSHGDVVGRLIYDIYEFSHSDGLFTVKQQVFVEVPTD